MPHPIKNPAPVAAERGLRSNTFDVYDNPAASTPATAHFHPLLRAAACHWNACPSERRERYVRFLQLHYSVDEISRWTETEFEDFEHSSQSLIFAAIACCCSDLFHVLVKRGLI